jgi:MFS family permease
LAHHLPRTAKPQNEYIALVRSNADFRNLWFGQIISLLGDWFNLIGSASLIAALTQSGFAVGGLFVVRMLAPFLVSPFAGVLADRYDRRRILIITDLLRAVIVLGFLLVRDANMVWLLYVLTALQLAVSGFFDPAKNAILPAVVTREQLGAANALSAATWSVMLSVGAAIGGLVAGQWGVHTAFIADSLTFLVSAFFIAQVRYRNAPLPSSDRSVSGALTQYVDGLRYLAQHRDVLMIAMQKGLLAISVAGGFGVVQVTLAERVFVIGEGGSFSLGILMMVFGVGTGLGPILARRFSQDRDNATRVAIGLSFLVSVVGLILIASLASFTIVNVGMFLRGLGGGIHWVFTTQLLLQRIPDQVRGRVFATEMAFLLLCSAIGAAWTGAMLDGVNLSMTVWLMIALSFLPLALWSWWTWRQGWLAKQVVVG